MSPAVKAHAVRRTTDILDRLQPLGLDAAVLKHLRRFLATHPSREAVSDYLVAMVPHFGTQRRSTLPVLRALVREVGAAVAEFDHLNHREALEALRYVVGWLLRFAEIPPNTAHPVE